VDVNAIEAAIEAASQVVDEVVSENAPVTTVETETTEETKEWVFDEEILQLVDPMISTATNSPMD